MTEKFTNLQITKIALQRAYSKLDSSNRALISACDFRLDYHNEYCQLVFIAPSLPIWKRLVKRIESITRRFSRVMSAFTVARCISDDPIPPGARGVWIVRRKLLIDQREFVQLHHEHHPYWVSVTPPSCLALVESKEPLKSGGRYVIDWKVILRHGGQQYLQTMRSWLITKCGRIESVFIFTGVTVSESNPTRTLAQCLVEGTDVVVRLDVRHLIPAPA